MKIRFFTIAILASMLAPISANAQKSEISVTPVAVREYRNRLLVPLPKGRRSSSSTLNVVLRFKGDDITKATQYGKYRVTEGKDNNGDAITLSKTSAYYQNRLMKVSRTSYSVLGKKLPADELEISLPLSLPARSARSLTTLKGSMTFAISETTPVSISADKLQALVGKTIEDPLLTKHEIKVTVSRYSSTGGSRLGLKIEGKNFKGIIKVHFYDPQGKKLDFSVYVFTGFRSSTASVSTSKPLPKGATLKLSIETKRTETVVDFDLKDIPLR
jgi:hypothetical protein